MLSVRSIYPIIIPQITFIDTFQQANSYVEMNPSMSIDPTGKVTILVRCVNYRKFHDKKYIKESDELCGTFSSCRQLKSTHFEFCRNSKSTFCCEIIDNNYKKRKCL